MNMELTITQNSALYFAQHKVSKRRAALFRQFGIAAKKEPPDVGQLTFGDRGAKYASLYRDDGR
jgi:hypothetical protein